MQRLYCRAGIYYFRIRVPLDLQPHFACQEIVKSLKTRSVQKASYFGTILTVEIEKAFNRLRSEIRSIRTFIFNL